MEYKASPRGPGLADMLDWNSNSSLFYSVKTTTISSELMTGQAQAQVQVQGLPMGHAL